MKKGRYILLCLSYFIILISGPILTQESINLTYPEVVIENQEFDIEINFNNFSNDTYDIKFVILNDTTNIGERFWEDEWKSTNFWMESAINTNETNKNTFKLKIKEDFSGLWEIIVKIRDSTNKILEFPENFITVGVNGSSNEEEEENNEEQNNETKETEAKIKMNIKWDKDDIRYGKDFKIEIKAFNLKNKKYDLKIWIEGNDSTITDRYNEIDETWKSGVYFINEFFTGPGNFTEDIELRIREQYKDFIGDAIIYVKLKDEIEISEDIDIIEKKEIIEPIINQIETKNVAIKKESPKKNSIRLGNKNSVITDNAIAENIKTDNSVNYESKTEIMKKYSLYFFNFLCIAIFILLGFQKLK